MPDFTAGYPDPAYSTGIVTGAMVAGLVCGVLPLVVGIVKQRYTLGRLGLGLCFICGLAGGVFVAGPAALAMTAVILLLSKPARRAETPSLWYGAYPQPGQTAPVPSGMITPGVKSGSVQMMPAGGVGLCCPKCSHLFAVGDGRVPPWCPHCGADFKLPAAPPAPVAPPPSASSPETGIISAEKLEDVLATTAQTEPAPPV
jgi:hypothetical protein